MKRFVWTCVLMALSLIPVTVFAGSLVFDPFNTCTGTNCSSQIINGTYHADASGDADPFILQVYSQGNECVRLDVIAEDSNLEMVLVSPAGRVWRNNDRNASNPRPLIKAISDVSGWYTLQVSQFNGAAVISDFTLRYGRYDINNPNCFNETPPL
jgi:hypothetical protein